MSPPSSSSQDMTFGSMAICGCSTSFIIFATGIACLVISIMGIKDSRENFGVDCGRDGKPPLLEWVFGTGISFLIISCAFGIVSSGRGGCGAKLILAVANLFVFIWAIVGAFSLWKNGTDCMTINPTLWRMGYAAVIISFIICCCGGFVGYKTTETPTAEPLSEGPQVVSEGP